MRQTHGFNAKGSQATRGAILFGDKQNWGILNFDRIFNHR